MRPPLLRKPAKYGWLCLLAGLACIVSSRPSPARAGGAGPDAALYLDQAEPVLADARVQINSLQFYLPVGSIKDPNDPTWSSAEQAAEALAEDRDALTLLSPPDEFAAVNAGLTVALTRASSSAETAVDSLSGGEANAGQAALAAFKAACSDFDRLAGALPTGFAPKSLATAST